jgi:hypothetical protein
VIDGQVLEAEAAPGTDGKPELGRQDACAAPKASGSPGPADNAAGSQGGMDVEDFASFADFVFEIPSTPPGQAKQQQQGPKVAQAAGGRPGPGTAGPSPKVEQDAAAAARQRKQEEAAAREARLYQKVGLRDTSNTTCGTT